jgi:hypothetical protein
MSKKLKLGIALLALGSGGFTWLILYMQACYPAAFFSLVSQEGSFSFSSAPTWLWGGLVLSLVCVVKGATNIGRGLKEE